MRSKGSKTDPRGEIVYLFLLWVYVFIYAAIKLSSRYVSVLITVANFLSVKTLYILVDALGKQDAWQDKLRVVISIIGGLGALMLGSVSGSVAYALLGEVLLYHMQYGVEERFSWQIDTLLACGFIFPVLSPVVAAVNTVEQVAFSPAFSSETGGVSCLFESTLA